MTRCIWIVCTVLAAGFLAAPALAEAPALMNYQGVLTDGEGFPIDGTYNLTFKIYGDSLGNTDIWEEDHNQVVVNHGLFNVVLGFTTPLPDDLFSLPNRFLGVTVEGDSEMAPRTRLTSVPWAMRAAVADSVTSGGDADDDWIISGINMYAAVPGSVGVGTDAPLVKLHVQRADREVPSSALEQEDLLVEDSDAGLGLYSSTGGTYGSLLSFGEVSEGLLTDKWTIVRTTSGSDSRLLFKYGENADYSQNTSLVTFKDGGKVGIMDSTPEANLNIQMGDGEYPVPNLLPGLLIRNGGFNLASKLEIQSKDGSTTYFVVDATGDVGIGVADPATELEIAGDTAELRLSSTTDTGSTLELKSTSGMGSGYIRFLDGNDDTRGFVTYRQGFGFPWGMHFSAGGSYRMSITESGNVGIGTSDPDELLDVDGTMQCDVLKISGGADIAEPFNIGGSQSVEPGMVVTIDPARPGELTVSTRAYDRCVAGVVSGAGDVDPGLIMAEKGSAADGEHPIALTGRVYCRATAANGPIQPGDLLTTSGVPGHAMRAADHDRAQGAVIGKAMTSLADDTGLVLVLVTLQ
ncbi:MAG: hypothetical protein GF355_06995 [Candidatus Eisenbacteria bacterium]|nr:hypothetical protein [Candidatus Eisenbacteria bacterium]